MKSKILILAPYFIPSVNAGGPVKSILNIVNSLSEQYEFFIITRDHDKGPETPFDASIKRNKWLPFNNSAILYAKNSKPSFYFFWKEVTSVEPKLIYVNSIFDYFFSIKLIILFYFGFFGKCKILVAPRGELSGGALSLKKSKKRLYLYASYFFRFYERKNIYFHATSKGEVDETYQKLHISRKNIFVSPNIPTIPNTFNNRGSVSTCLKVIFLSRITPKKNLHFALKVLSKVDFDIQFDIYGPKEDNSYWVSCEDLIKRMPSNIKVKYIGKVALDDVHHVFSKYDLFLFPTLGENYGHVIVEALMVGTRVLISDRTPWNIVGKFKLGYALPLVEKKFIDALNSFSEIRDTVEERDSRIQAANSLVGCEFSVNETKSMFIELLEKKYV